MDIDECATNTSSCDPKHATCTNNQGSFSCACNQHYVGDGTQCLSMRFDQWFCSFYLCVYIHIHTFIHICISFDLTEDQIPLSLSFGVAAASFCSVETSPLPWRDCIASLHGWPERARLPTHSDSHCTHRTHTHTHTTHTHKHIHTHPHTVGISCAKSNPCDPKNAFCRIVANELLCTCKPGYTGDGYTCTDVNECTCQNPQAPAVI